MFFGNDRDKFLFNFFFSFVENLFEIKADFFEDIREWFISINLNDINLILNQLLLNLINLGLLGFS